MEKMILNSADIFHPSDGIEKLFIKNIWRLYEYNALQKIETILPKGNVEIIFNFSEDIIYQSEIQNDRFQLPLCFINGLNFKPFTLVKNGQQKFLGIQLNSLGVKVLFDLSIKELNDKVLEGRDVCKALTIISEKLSNTTTFNDQVNIIMSWVNQRINQFKEMRNMNRIHQLFYSNSLNSISVNNLSIQAYLSDRQLRRLSIEWLGMSTRSFLQYNRYLLSLNLLHASNLSLTEIGLEAGYYDQSHFIKEFKSFTTINPSDYKYSKKGMQGHIFR